VPPEWLASSPGRRSRATVWTRGQEAHLFRKMNYLKWRANQLREQLDPSWPSPGALDEIERLQAEALALKNRIVEMYLLLVVSIAKRRSKPGYDLSECVSDGSVALMQAVDGFDYARGNRFSTYATWAIRNVLAEQERRFIRGRGQPLGIHEESVAAPDSDTLEQEREEAQSERRNAVKRWLGRLDKRERLIVSSRYGIDGVPQQTLVQIGRELGVSKERVRQIATRALAKLRNFARNEGLEPLGERDHERQ
jgi:RNA polymerase primary sigma factor